MNAYPTSRRAAVAAGSRLRIGVAALCIGALTLSAGQLLAAPTIDICQTAKSKAVSESSLRSTTSTTFVSLPGAAVSFIQGGASNSCVIVFFFADVGANPNTVMSLRATLDGVASAKPSARQIAYSQPLYLAHGASFIFSGVAPGTHTVRIQYLSNLPGQSVYVINSNTIVQFAP